MVQIEKKIPFQKIGEEEGINSTLKRRIQETFVGHQDRTRAIPYIAKSAGVRGHSRTRQTLSGAGEPKNLNNWFGGLGPMATWSRVMITATKLGKSVANDDPRIEV